MRSETSNMTKTSFEGCAPSPRCMGRKRFVLKSPVNPRAGGRIPFRGRGAPCRRGSKNMFPGTTVSKAGRTHDCNQPLPIRVTCDHTNRQPPGV